MQLNKKKKIKIQKDNIEKSKKREKILEGILRKYKKINNKN